MLLRQRHPSASYVRMPTQPNQSYPAVPLKKFFDFEQRVLRVLEFALPDDECIPSKVTEGAYGPFVARLIIQSFSGPEFGASFGSAARATIMRMPEAAVNENHLSPARKNDVGTSG